jgi:hypothetical protein
VRHPIPAIVAVVSFIDAINRSDVARIASLMTEDHRLQVFDEWPLDGKEANIEAWRGYTSSFPDYVIYPHQVVARNADVIVLGHTTGSHLDLPDEQETGLTLLWRTIVRDGRLQVWQLIEDTPDRRAEFGIGPDA